MTQSIYNSIIAPFHCLDKIKESSTEKNMIAGECMTKFLCTTHDDTLGVRLCRWLRILYRTCRKEMLKICDKITKKVKLIKVERKLKEKLETRIFLSFSHVFLVELDRFTFIYFLISFFLHDMTNDCFEIISNVCRKLRMRK